MTALARGIEMARGYKGRGSPTIYDRMSADLPINARVAPAVVDDPLEPGAKLRVARSLRDDTLGFMLARNEIKEHQYEAGRRYERHAEAAEIGNIRAIDPTKEAVDGGGIVEPISDGQIAAVRHLSEAARVLGRHAEFVVRSMLVEKRRFPEIARSQSRADIAHVRMTFIDGLEELAYLWGLTTAQQIRHK